MHPEIMRELTAQHGRDLREQAHRATMRRSARRTLRGWWHARHQVEAEEYVIPAIPDYVDGSFRTTGDETASQVPAAHRAA
jgi:hypothetical protein